MTDRHPLTYTGPLARGTQALPTRRVHFERGGTVEFTLEELDHLDPTTWTGDRPAGVAVPGELVVTDGSSEDLVLVDGKPLGTVAEVKELATTPERAAALLAAETATKNRPTLVAWLTAQADATTTEEP